MLFSASLIGKTVPVGPDPLIYRPHYGEAFCLFHLRSGINGRRRRKAWCPNKDGCRYGPKGSFRSRTKPSRAVFFDLGLGFPPPSITENAAGPRWR